MKDPRGQPLATLCQDDRDCSPVLRTGPRHEALGGETIDEADGSRVRQAEYGAQLRDRSAVEKLVHRGESRWDGSSERCDRLDCGVHPVGEYEAKRSQDVDGVWKA